MEEEECGPISRIQWVGVVSGALVEFGGVMIVRVWGGISVVFFVKLRVDLGEWARVC